MMPYALPPAETRLPLLALLRGMIPRRADFSKKFTAFLGTDGNGCVLAGNAKSLLYLLLCALKDQAGARNVKEVLLPGYTCYSVAAAVVKAGLRVAIYDLNPHTFQPDFEDVRRKINPATLAVIGQHLLGVKADIKKLADIAHQQGICCIEDSAQYLEAGQFGPGRCLAADYALFSFGRGKPLPLGGGGALVAKDQETLARMDEKLKVVPRQIANRVLPFAVQVLSWPRFYWFLEKLPLGLGRTVYDPEFGAVAMSMLHLRIGENALVALDRINQHRAIVSRIYQSHFGESREAICPHVRFPLLVRNQSEFLKISSFGVRRLYPLALCELPALKDKLAENGTLLSGVKEIASQLITLPTHINVDRKIAKDICDKASIIFRDIRIVNQIDNYIE